MRIAHNTSKSITILVDVYAKAHPHEPCKGDRATYKNNVGA